MPKCGHDRYVPLSVVSSVPTRTTFGSAWRNALLGAQGSHGIDATRLERRNHSGDHRDCGGDRGSRHQNARIAGSHFENAARDDASARVGRALRFSLVKSEPVEDEPARSVAGGGFGQLLSARSMSSSVR